MKKKIKDQSKLPIHEATPEIPSGRFWTMCIEQGAPAVLGKDILPGTMIMKNHGPGTIVVVDTGYNESDRVELLPGVVRIIAIHNKVHVANLAEKSALLEFEFIPKNRVN